MNILNTYMNKTLHISYELGKIMCSAHHLCFMYQSIKHRTFDRFAIAIAFSFQLLSYYLKIKYFDFIIFKH